MASASCVPPNNGLFCKDSLPLTFYIIPCKKKKALQELVTRNGGELSGHRREAQYILYNPGDIVSDETMVSTDYIDDCVKENKLLDIEQYRYSVRQAVDNAAAKVDGSGDGFAFDDALPVTSPTSSTKACKKGEYTVGEDLSIIAAVLKECKQLSINGNRLWELIAARKVTTRSSLSMKERFIKKILPYIENYDITDAELRRVKKLRSSKSERVTFGTGRLHRRNQLDFLRAPPAERMPNTYQLVSSSSEEESFSSNVLVTHTPLKRKRKAPLVELLSSNSEPSSQSQDSQQNQTKWKGLAGKRNKTNLTQTNPSVKRSSRASPNAEDHSPTANERSVKVRSSVRQSQQSSSFGQSASSSHGNSVVSYVIEDSSSEVQLSPTLTSPQTAGRERKRNKSERDNVDLALLGTPPKAAAKLPSVIKLPQARRSSPKRLLSAEATKSVPKTLADASVSTSIESRLDALDTLPAGQSYAQSCKTAPDVRSRRPEKGAQNSLNQVNNRSSKSKESSVGSPSSRDRPFTQPFTVTLSNGLDNSYKTQQSNLQSSCTDQERTSCTEQELIDNSGTVSSPIIQLMDQAEVSTTPTDHSAILEALTALSPLLFAEGLPLRNKVSSVLSQQHGSEISEKFLNKLVDAQNSLTVSESEELFQRLIMSDSLKCDTYSQSKSQTERTEGESSAAPASNQQSCFGSKNSDEHLETQLSWSSWDPESQKEKRLSLESTKSETNQNNSRMNAVPTERASPVVTSSVTAQNSGDRILRRSPRGKSSATASADVTTLSGENSALPLTDSHPASTSQKSLTQYKTATHSDYSLHIIELPATEKQRGVDSTVAAVVNDSPKITKDLNKTPVRQRRRSVARSPPPLHRTCRLNEIVKMPLRQPQYEDAKSVITLTQESEYADCVSSHESDVDASFKSVSSTLDKQVESKSVIKVEMNPKAVPGTPQQPGPVTNTSQQSGAVANTSQQPGAVANTSQQPGAVTNISQQPGPVTNTSQQPGPVTNTSQQAEPVTNTSQQAEPVPSTSKQPDPVPSTSKHSDTNSVDKRQTQLYISKCAQCSERSTDLCHIDELKSHAMYSKLMYTHRIEDIYLIGFVCQLSADWEVIEQHIKSDGKVGALWTQRDDRLLTNPCFKRKNTKELRKKFSDREIKARKRFLLERVDLTPKQRKTLLGMAQ